MKKIQTKNTRTINEKTLIATVDIGKVKNMGYCRCPDGTDIKPFEFFNNGRGFNIFWRRVTQIMKTRNLQKVVIGFESTGPYPEPLLHYLMKKAVNLVQVNPMHTKKLKELQGNSPNKTDKKDPKVIADIIELGHALTVVIPEGSAAELRRLTQARERSMQRRTNFFNQLQDLVFVLFPEFFHVMKDVKTKSAQYLLKHYPVPQDIMEYGLESLTVTLRNTSRGKLGRDRAKSLYEAAIESVGIKEAQESVVFEITEILANIETSEHFISEVEKRMSYYLKQIPYSRSILSLKGIGEVTTAGLIGEVGDFSQFKTISEITKLAGFDLFEISSGFDISSGGEFSKCLSVGISPQHISFSGPGKNEKELSKTISNKIFTISVESQREIEKIVEIVKNTSSTANIMLRINPAKKPDKFSLKMGGLPSQFGFDEETVPAIIRMIKKHDSLIFMGIHVFSGTQCLDSKAIINNISETIEIAKRISQQEDVGLRYVNLGGGFGVPYHEGDEELNIQKICNAIKDILHATTKTSQKHNLKDTKFILELGRFLVAQSGIYIAKIMDIKVSKGEKFVVLNGGMNHHLAASGNLGQVLRRNNIMYPLEVRNENKKEKVNIVGPLCTPIDRLATEILLPELRIGDFIGIFNSGAYGFTASPLLFLSHSLPNEVFQFDKEIKVFNASEAMSHLRDGT